MNWEKAVFFLLLALTAAFGLRVALQPSPSQSRVLLLAQSMHHDLAEIKRVADRAFFARDPGELQDALVRVRELLQSFQAKLDQLEAILGEMDFALWPTVLFRIEGSDIVVRIAGVQARGLALGVGGPGLRWNPETWELKEIEVLAKDAEFLCSDGCGPGELRFALLAKKSMQGAVLRLKGQGMPVLWLPAQEHIQLVDEQNQLVREFVVAVW